MMGRERSHAIVFEQPGHLSCRAVGLCTMGPEDLLVDIEYSGISTGTERLLWEGRMPHFPGLAYPLVPGYESVGRVIDAGDRCSYAIGDRVFVPGAACYTGDVRGLFGATASRVIVPESRCIALQATTQSAAQDSVLLALAATAMHLLTHRLGGTSESSTVTLDTVRDNAPELIIGHGTLGRLLARICLAVGAPAPRVWEQDPARRVGTQSYDVVAMQDDERQDYLRACDVSGGGGALFDDVIARLRRGGAFTLGGFYSQPVSFSFAPAFMREIALNVAAEWLPSDLALVTSLIDSKALSLEGLVTHTELASNPEAAYQRAFDDPECLKMVLDWRPS